MIRHRLSVVLFLFAFVSLHAQDFNLNMETRNPQTGFAQGWTAGFSKDQREAYEFKLDSNIKKSGRYSLSIEKKTDGADFAPLDQIIKPVYAGQRIRLRGWIKTESVDSGWAGFWMRIDGPTGNLAFDNMQSRGIKGTRDWQQRDIELEYDEENATSIHIGALLVGKGKIWIDDLAVEIDGKDLASAPRKKAPVYAAKSDTAFQKGSGIALNALTPLQVANLTNLGTLWGFLKYHHPVVAEGKVNMDAALFRVLPQVLAAKDKAAAGAALEVWTDGFGVPEVCKNCKEPGVDSLTKLRPDYGHLFATDNLPSTLVKKLDFIRQNRNRKKNYYISLAPGVGNPVFSNEESYPEMIYPDGGYRLLALFRYWNMIQYFFPYKHLIGEDWNAVLPVYLPRFAEAKDSAQYTLACLSLIGRIHDTHANIWRNNAVLNAVRGKYWAPVQATFVEDKLAVTGYYKKDSSLRQRLRIGDVIQSINGVAVEQLIKQNLEFTPASNYPTQLRDLPKTLLRGATPEISIEVLRDGRSFPQTLSRYEAKVLDFGIDRDPAPQDSSYKLIGDIGYVYPGKWKNSQLPAVKKLFKNTKGIIVDMRCYPSEFMPFTFGTYLKAKDSPFVKFTTGSVETPGLFTFGSPLSNGAAGKEAYPNKVVVIVDAGSQSQAEYTTMAFQSSPAVTVIGSTTAGADGNVSSIVLPGNVFTMISGIGVYYPDGTETQRQGVRIDVPVKPTLKGIKEGRDEPLEKAMEIIRPGKPL